MGTANDKKGWCRATTAEPDKIKKPSSVSAHGQTHHSKPVVREAPGVVPVPGCVEMFRRTKRAKLEAGGGVHRDRKHHC